MNIILITYHQYPIGTALTNRIRSYLEILAKLDNSVKVIIFRPSEDINNIWNLRTGIVAENFQTSVLKIEAEPIHIYNATTGKANEGEISRVAGYVLGFQSILHSPTGYGFPKNESEFGLLGFSPNAFMNLCLRWGILGITFIIISMIMTVKFLLFHYNIKVSRIVQ